MGQAEVAFVPARERQQTRSTAVEESVKDSIVVVGQTQRKKRKRVATAKVVEKEEDATTTVGETFDYSTVGNILDEGSDHEAEAVEGGRKRRHKVHGAFLCIDCDVFGATQSVLAVGSDTLVCRSLRLWKLPSATQSSQRGQVWKPIAYVQVVGVTRFMGASTFIRGLLSVARRILR